MATIVNSNGTSTPKPPTRLELLHQAFIASGGKPPPAKVVKELVAAWEAARVAKEQAESALVAAELRVSDASAALVRQCVGKARITVKGVVYVPMSRAETVFYRREGSAEAIDLG